MVRFRSYDVDVSGSASDVILFSSDVWFNISEGASRPKALSISSSSGIKSSALIAEQNANGHCITTGL